MHAKLFLGLAALLLLSGLLNSQTTRNPAKEQVICDQLAAIAPQAVETFKQATAAMDKRDYANAAPLFREVLKQAPQFTPAMRRLGFSVAGLGQADEGLALMQNAVKIERSPENLSSLAETLAYPAPNKEGSLQQKEAALLLAKEAMMREQNSDDPSYPLLVAQLALDLKHDAEFRQATETLASKYPNLMASHYLNAIRNALDENWVKAEDEIKQAGRMGLPAQTVQRFLDAGVHTRATAWRWGYYVAYLLAAWALGLFVLFLSGKLFSKLTLRFIENADVNATVTPAETRLRRYYRRLIAIAGTYYYISQPIVMFLVIAVTAAIVYGFLVLGHIPVKLVILLVLGAIVTVYKMIHSLFVKVSSEEPGRALTEAEAPGLWKLTREVAEKLETRPLDAIRVVPGTEMAVYERGSYRDRRKGLGTRTLIMGLGLIPGFDQNPFPRSWPTNTGTSPTAIPLAETSRFASTRTCGNSLMPWPEPGRRSGGISAFSSCGSIIFFFVASVMGPPDCRKSWPIVLRRASTEPGNLRKDCATSSAARSNSIILRERKSRKRSPRAAPCRIFMRLNLSPRSR